MSVPLTIIDSVLVEKCFNVYIHVCTVNWVYFF